MKRILKTNATRKLTLTGETLRNLTPLPAAALAEIATGGDPQASLRPSNKNQSIAELRLAELPIAELRLDPPIFELGELAIYKEI